MAGASFNIEYDDREVTAALSELQRRLGPGMKTVFADIGESLLNSHKARWSSEQAPDGTPWEPLDPKYQARKKKNADKILVLDGYLKDLLDYNETETEMKLGTNLLYGATHQFGDPTRGIPARPFLGLSESDRQDVLEILNEYLSEPLK